MTLKSSKLVGTILLCSIALSACAPIQKRIVKIIPGNAQTSTVVSQEIVQPTQPRRVVKRVAPSTRVAKPTPVTAAPVRTNTSTATPVIPVAVEVKPAKKDCSVAGTSGCPVTRSFGEGGDGNGGGGGGWSG